MTAGELTTLLILQVDATQPQGAGRSAGQAWAEVQDVARLWAKVENRTGREVQAGNIASSSGQYNVTIRWRNDISEKSRFAVRTEGRPDRLLYVTHVPIGQRAEFLTILCEEIA